MPTAEELLSKLQEIDDSHKNDKKSFIDPLNSERDKKVFYEKSQCVNQFLLPKDMEDKEELLELCQINFQQLENAQKDHLTIFRPQLKDAWQNLAKRIVKKIKRYGQLNDDTINYAGGCGFDPNSDNLDIVDIKEIQGAGVPKSLGDVKAGLNILKDAAKDAKQAMKEESLKSSELDNATEDGGINIPSSQGTTKKRSKGKWIFKIIFIGIFGSCFWFIGGNSWDNAEVSNGTINATCTVNYTISTDQVGRDVMGIAYSLAKKYSNADRLKLRVYFTYKNSYGEKKKVDIGIFSPDLDDVRKYSSSSNYKYNSSDKYDVAGMLLKTGIRF